MDFACPAGRVAFVNMRPLVAARRDWRLMEVLFAAVAAACLPGTAHAQRGSPAVSAGCHRDIWETYRRTGMARSFDRPSPEKMVEDFSGKNTFYHQASDSYFTMLRRGGKY